MNKENKKVEVSELLAEIVRNSNGTVALYIFEAGSQHVETIHTQIIGNPPKQPTNPPKQPTTNPEKEQPLPNPLQKEREPRLPEVLATEEAVKIWKKVQEAGYVDANYQPLLSRTQSALLADAIAERLGIRQKWKTFETLSARSGKPSRRCGIGRICVVTTTWHSGNNSH